VFPLTPEYFYRSKHKPKGFVYECKECRKQIQKQRERENPAYKEWRKRYSREYWKKYYKTEKGKIVHYLAQKRYNNSDKGRVALLKSRRKWRKNNPEKYAAHIIVTNALASGKFVRQPCEICGNKNSQAHHEDYSKPLVVRWLCDKHHREVHRHI